MTVAVHGPLVPPYIVRQAVQAIDQVLAEQQSEEDTEESEEGDDEQ